MFIQDNEDQQYFYITINNFLIVMTQFDSKLIAQAKKTKGYLLKKSISPFSTWKKLYFLFIDDALCFFKDQTLQNLQKSLCFSQILQVNSSDPFLIQIKTLKKLYYFKAQSSADQDLWIASLNILKENHLEQIKGPKKALSSSPSSLNSHQGLFKRTESPQKIKRQKSNKKQQTNSKIIYLLREKQLSRFLSLLNLQKLSAVTKEQKFLSRILFIEDKKNGIFFSLSSKSIYPLIDGELVKEDLIYPYQLNILYFLPLNLYKAALEDKHKSLKLIEVCKCNQIVQSCIVNQYTIKLQIHSQKSVQIEVKYLSLVFVNNLLACIKKLVQVGKEYWNLKGKLLKNIDEFVEKYRSKDQNELVFYKMVEVEFNLALSMGQRLCIAEQKRQSIREQKKQLQMYFNKLDQLTINLKNFVDACQIKSNPENQIKQKFTKLYHKFVYNFLSRNWNHIYMLCSDEDLIVYSKKVYHYFQVFNQIHHDLRVKEGYKTLLKIALKNFHQAVGQLIHNFTDVEQESLRILKKVEVEKSNQGASELIFLSSFCTSLFSTLTSQFRSLVQIPRSEDMVRYCWMSMHRVSKQGLGRLSNMVELIKERQSLLSILNSVKLLKKIKIPQLFNQLDKTVMFLHKKEKQDYLKSISYELSLIQTFSVKKLFVIIFGNIDKELLKLEIKFMDFAKICAIVIQEIDKLQNILQQVRTAIYDSAFEEVCYFFYICVVKFDNKVLTKDQCLSMINQKMTSIKDAFTEKVEQERIAGLLKDLNLLKQFITCPINMVKQITKELKKVFGSNFTQINLKNLISLRVSSLKQKQHIFEQCREQIKDSSQSTDELQSFQHESLHIESYFRSSNSYHRQRISTLTQSLKSYCQQFQKMQCRQKKQRTILFGIQNSLHEGYMMRKKIINLFNTYYKRFYYRLKKGKLLEYDNEESEHVLNCYLFSQLKKCFLEPQNNECIQLKFLEETIKLKPIQPEDSLCWIQKILEAMEEQKKFTYDFDNEDPDDDEGVLFQDLSKKITPQTKQTKEASSPKQKQKVKQNKKLSSGINKISPKKTHSISPGMVKKQSSGSKQRPVKKGSKQKAKQPEKKEQKRSKEGCGAGCNFF